MRGPQDHGVTQPTCNQGGPAEHERAHQDIAQVGIVLNDREQMLAIDLDHFAGHQGADANEARAPGKGAHLARELPRTEDCDEIGLPEAGADRFQLARRHDKDSGALPSHLEEYLVLHYGTAAAMSGDPAQLLRRDRGNNVASGVR